MSSYCGLAHGPGCRLPPKREASLCWTIPGSTLKTAIFDQFPHLKQIGRIRKRSRQSIVPRILAAEIEDKLVSASGLDPRHRYGSMVRGKLSAPRMPHSNVFRSLRPMRCECRLEGGPFLWCDRKRLFAVNVRKAPALEHTPAGAHLETINWAFAETWFAFDNDARRLALLHQQRCCSHYNLRNQNHFVDPSLDGTLGRSSGCDDARVSRDGIFCVLRSQPQPTRRSSQCPFGLTISARMRAAHAFAVWEASGALLGIWFIAVEGRYVTEFPLCRALSVASLVPKPKRQPQPAATSSRGA